MTLNQLMLITHLAQDALLCLSARRKSSERGVLHWPEPHRSEGRSTAVMSWCSKIRGRVLLVYTDIQRYTNYRNSRVPSIRYRSSKLASEELFYFACTGRCANYKAAPRHLRGTETHPYMAMSAREYYRGLVMPLLHELVSDVVE